ncbi:hypothetical protein ACFOY5_22800 [Massilia aurea]|jgi:hypothetical protein|uniref:hypothetical protein n=1 Tax=Massilia aurea TaxID=373040 RepID=UPI0021634D7E|nr:hypothetical protein [Massilia aurea]MCS0708342.1 hypothetical protein [Massilia aurea]
MSQNTVPVNFAARKIAMTILRLLCFAAGMLVLVAPAIVLPAGAMTPHAGKAAATLACLVLGACAFFVTGMAGHLLRRSALLRALAALLLAVPLAFCAALLWRGAAPAFMWTAGVLLGFTLTLYLTFVYPVLRAQTQAWLRWRAARQLASLH